jgi:hypothetical protein
MTVVFHLPAENHISTSSSSSSFIEPPATGHHRWSGAKKKHFSKIILVHRQGIVRPD